MRTLAIALLLLPPITVRASAPAPSAPSPTTNLVAPYLHPSAQPQMPDMTQNYQKTVVIPAQEAAQAAAQAQAQQLADQQAQDAQAASPAVTAPSESLSGTLGYSLDYGNCVDMAIAYGKDQPGNPISWEPSTTVPFIGAAALFPFNHVGVVVGIWGNGDLEIAQENAPGMPHRFPVSEFRGFF